MVKASIIVTSYNQAPTVELLLVSLTRQTVMDFEVVIADDGSSDGTAELCKKHYPFSIQFVTQSDDGYRKSKIVNEAVRKSKGDYLIFLDGDVVLEKHFVEDHLALRRENSFVCGRRVDLGPEFSKRVNVEYVSAGKLDGFNIQLLMSGVKKDSINLNRGFRIRNGLIRKVFKYDRDLDILGSNFGAWKKDILEVNGFNEELESYWGEDGDLFIRLRNKGLKNIGVLAKCVQHHVFHKRRAPTKENEERFYRLLKDSNYKWAPKGIND